jgi:hypothetical protein
MLQLDEESPASHSSCYSLATRIYHIVCPDWPAAWAWPQDAQLQSVPCAWCRAVGGGGFRRPRGLSHNPQATGRPEEVGAHLMVCWQSPRQPVACSARTPAHISRPSARYGAASICSAADLCAARGVNHQVNGHGPPSHGSCQTYPTRGAEVLAFR